MFSFLKRLIPNKKKSGYYFIHIPKTAGTSFINLLDSCVHQNEIFPSQLWHQINQKTIAEKQKYTLLRGHFGGGSYKLLADNNPHRLTILRHPESLSISTYHFIKREKNTAVHDLVNKTDMDLKSFLEEPLTAIKINNRMVRHLSFDLQKDPEAQELFLSSQSIKVVNNWIKTPKSINNKKRLIRAKNAINECSWFGIQEKFDQSMQLFSFTFNRPPVGKTPYLNAHKPNQNIDNYCKQLISKQNKLDLVLYQYALEIFNQKYKGMCDFLKHKYSNQNLSIDEMLDKNYQESAQSILKNGCHYEFGMALLGSGWHRRELAQPENTYFRWTNNNNSFIDFWLEPKDYDLEIRIINAVSLKHLSELDLCVNNISIPYEYDYNEGVVRIISTKINQSMLKNKLLRIQFIHSQPLKHNSVFDSNDNRKIGIAVNWIKITPNQT
jgi:hypothetical protein